MKLLPEAAHRNRKRLIAALEPGDLVLVPGSGTSQRNSDVDHRFRQNSDFLYLTAFDEPGAMAAIEVTADGVVYTLFVPPKNPEREVWDGFRAGVDGATRRFGADQAFANSDIDEQLVKLVDGAKRILYPLNDATMAARVARARGAVRARARTGAVCPDISVELGSLLHEQRLIKDQHELELMARAGQISVQAHREAMTAGLPGSSENAIEGLIEGRFRALGAKRFAYPSIVAAGANGCVLHYHDNDAPIVDGDMLLIDAGCEYSGYASDITVTWPASGRFSAPQRRVYEAVLRVQQAVIEEIRPGASFQLLNDTACRLLVEEMQGLGLLDAGASVEELLSSKAYQPYYMHSIGHWIGMDVHDVGAYGEHRSRPFEAGMVLTVEPGIYIAPDAEQAPEDLRGIAVRIEDDIAVTDDGYRNLTHGLPRSVEAIEAFMAESRAQR